MQMESEILQVNIDDIIPNRFQPRLSFDDQGLKELSDSIKEHGIIQPLVLRKLGSKYEIIAGERRYKAAQMAGLATVPAVISNVDDNSSAELALVENIQRRDLTPIEEARSYKNLLDKGYLTQEQLAQKMGISQSTIANKLRLLNLDDEVQQALLDGKISERHARSLLVLNDKNVQKEWLNRIIVDRLTVRQLDQELKKIVDETEVLNEIPLVDINPDIEQIKNNAVDIHAANDKNVSNLMVSEDVLTDYSDTLPKEEEKPSFVNDDKYDTLSFNEPLTPNIELEEPKKPDVIKQESLFDFRNINDNQNENTIEVFDDAPKNIEEESTLIEPIYDNYNSFGSNDSIEELNPNNKFFTPIPEEEKPEQISKPIMEFDPMSMLGELPKEENTVNTSANKIMEVVTKLQNEGQKIKISEEDRFDSRVITIELEK